jgi:hypothetical protein
MVAVGLYVGLEAFAIFDAFGDQAGRDAHLAGRVAASLRTQLPPGRPARGGA